MRSTSQWSEPEGTGDLRRRWEQKRKALHCRFVQTAIVSREASDRGATSWVFGSVQQRHMKMEIMAMAMAMASHMLLLMHHEGPSFRPRGCQSCQQISHCLATRYAGSVSARKVCNPRDPSTTPSPPPNRTGASCDLIVRAPSFDIVRGKTGPRSCLTRHPPSLLQGWQQSSSCRVIVRTHSSSHGSDRITETITESAIRVGSNISLNLARYSNLKIAAGDLVPNFLRQSVSKFS